MTVALAALSHSRTNVECSCQCRAQRFLQESRPIEIKEDTLVTSTTLSFTQITDLIPGVFAVWADEPVPAGPPFFLFERFPAVCTASFSTKKTLSECESFCLSHCCHLRMRWTLTFQYFEIWLPAERLLHVAKRCGMAHVNTHRGPYDAKVDGISYDSGLVWLAERIAAATVRAGATGAALVSTCYSGLLRTGALTENYIHLRARWRRQSE
jgi:hypothetical protein